MAEPMKIYTTSDNVLPLLNLKKPCKITVTVLESKILLQIGQRDYSWDRETEELIGCGTLLIDTET